jgi:hypothetical protein
MGSTPSAQHAVDQAVAREQEAPQHRHRDGAAQDAGQVERRAEEVDAAQLEVQHVRDEQRKAHAQRHRQHREPQRDAQALAEQRVFESQLAVVLQPHEDGAGPSRRTR